ncbi:hypothetical protein SAMN02799630_04019 [Paenibacillus sp. UNCCL117]|uniref:hypothetical protein n=1 Tax=unclassified Paenibacillus TaxID=185978 RepID=UPI000880CFAC|nr:MULTISPECIES: hypothetical protein [unclassified Paenibacillus]SDD77970.1 hypothetical protein SAMN04488602_11384 [Paenibacillus sp. cl123]SFW52867.1 hypothetical protein SAMN02799630_04019 [Paenibacillus sp. UNCCL117]
MEWPIDMPLLVFMLGFTVWAVAPWMGTVSRSLSCDMPYKISCWALIMGSHDLPGHTRRIVFIRRKRPPLSSDNPDAPSLSAVASR